MALIKCPECNGTVSDKASSCPQCGAPVKTSVCENREVEYPIHYDGEIMDASKVLICMHDNHDATKRAIWDMCEAVGVAEDDETISEFVGQIYDLYQRKYSEYPPRIALMIPYSQAQINQLEYERTCEAERTKLSQPNLPKCPVCGSTNLIKQGAAGRAVGSFLFGAFSPEGRAQWICKNCNHMF